MKKYIKSIFVVLCCAVVFAPNAGMAGDDWKQGTSGGCWRNDRKEFYYCGDQTKTCASKEPKSSSVLTWTYDSHSATINGSTYWCCGGKKTGSYEDDNGLGVWRKGDYWCLGNLKTKVKEYSDGKKCNQIVCDSVCGTESVIEDCNVEDPCPTGQKQRDVNGVSACYDICPYGQAYENASSSTCVDCSVTNYQGIDNSGTCIRCDSVTQVWNRSTKKCVNKSTLSQFGKNDMLYGKGKTKNTVPKLENQCWTKTDSREYEKCVKPGGLIKGVIELSNFNVGISNFNNNNNQVPGTR